GPPYQIGHRVRREEIGSHSLSSDLPCGMLNAVLANIEPQSFPVIRPCASGAIEASVLVIHLKNCTRAIQYFALLKQDLRHAHRGAPTGSGMVIIFLRKRLGGIWTK